MRTTNILAPVVHTCMFITVAVGYQINNVRYENYATLEDLEPVTSIQPIASSITSGKCAIRCSSIAGVSGLFHNRHDGRCLCSTTLQRPTDTLLSSEGFRYYIKENENSVYFIDGTLKNGDFVFSDNTVIPDSVYDWGQYEPSRFPRDDCLCLFTNLYRHGDTTCSGFVQGYNFGLVCERVI